MQVKLDQTTPTAVGFYIVMNNWSSTPTIVEYDEDGDVVDSAGYTYHPSEFEKWSTVLSITEA